MSKIIFDVETCSEKYKEHIRGANYSDTITRTTKESMVFSYKDKKYTVKFSLEFSFDFENRVAIIFLANLRRVTVRD